MLYYLLIIVYPTLDYLTYYIYIYYYLSTIELMNKITIKDESE